MRSVPKILIVDDSATSCLYITRILQSAHYQAITASSGREGLQKMQQELPQCLILDIVLPDISGFEVCRKVRANDSMRLVPIIMVSSKNTATDRYWGLRQGATRYLVKPFTEDALLQMVKEVIPVYVHPAVVREPMPQTATKQSRARHVQEQLPLAKLIPRRVRNNDFLWMSKPDSALVSDREARFLYLAIDGHKNVERLCLATQMNMEGVSRILRLLLSLQRIQLYDADGRAVDGSRIFSEL